MKINFFLVIVFISFIVYANIDYLHGIAGMTLRDGGIGCVCHNFERNDSVFVWIEGPDSVFRGDTVNYKLFLTGGPAIAGGFDLASNWGELDSTDTLTHVLFGELTHTQPQLFTSDTLFWNFIYVAPDTILTDTLYSVGNSVNGDSIPSSDDHWNFGNNFAIQVLDFPVNIAEENPSPQDFNLQQNYPNPFNPNTVISYQLSVNGDVTLKVYDVLGNEVVTLVNEYKPAGKYKVELSAANLLPKGSLTSGIYFYRLQVSSLQSSIEKAENPSTSSGQVFIETKKMVLLK